MPYLKTFIFCLILVACVDAFAEQSSGNLEISQTASNSDLPKACIVPVEGMFKNLLLTTVKRRTEKAIEDGCELIVYRIKSDGGELGAAFELSNYVFALDENIKTIAYVEDKAYSAAALFSLACDELYMKSLSSIGDCEPIIPTQGGYTTAGEKIQSPLRERFRTFSRVNGYPELLAQSMVSSELKILKATHVPTQKVEFFRSEDWEILSDDEKKKYKGLKIVCHKGDLLTLGAEEAVELNFAKGIFPTAQDLLKELGYREDIQVRDINQTEAVINRFETWTPILLIVAMFFLYLEVKTPGVGAFGAISAVAFGAFFVGKFYTGQANYMEVLLFILGFVFLAMELFVFPGFGIAGLVGVILLFSSLLLAMQDFAIPDGDYQVGIAIHNLTMLCTSFLIATVLFLLSLWVMSKSNMKVIPGLVLEEAQKIEVPHMDREYPSLIGKRGVCITKMMPGGKIRIDQQEYQAAVEKGWLGIDSEVEVIHQEGNQLLVCSVENV